VYHLNLNTGVTLAHVRLSGAYYILAANDTEALVVRDPPELKTRVQVDQTTPVPLAEPIWKIRRAALDVDRSIWLINWFGVLFRFKPDAFSSPQYLNQPDGLLNNIVGVVEIGPDGGVWIGSSSGVSYLLNDTEQWETYAVEDGWRGPVCDFVFAADGSVWVMWSRQYHVAASPGAWGVTHIQANGNLQHYDLNQLTGINAPHSDDAIVLDVYGRLWFIAYQPNPPELFLGILDTDGELATPLYSLGRMQEKLAPLTVSRSNLTVGTHGILQDGSGGVYLYNGADLPLRHWRP